MLPPARAAVSVSHETLKSQALAADVSAANELDRLLFRTPVRLIDSANDFVATVRTLEAAQQAVAAGLGASYFAELAPGVAAVDVDLDDDETASALLYHLAQWCDDHSVWWCSRPSGGGPGRWHLLAAAGELLPILRSLVLELRQEWSLSATQLDWRATLRPLSAPHRAAGQVPLPAELPELLTDLQRRGIHRLGVLAPRRARPFAVLAATAESAGEPIALSPAFWDGLRCPGPTYRADRSGAELIVTAKLKAAGYTGPEAWKVLADPTHVVGSRARRKGRHWWETYVWSAATAATPVEPGSQPRLPRTFTDGYDWHWLTLPVAGAVRSAWGSWSTRERHSGEQVAAVVSEYLTAARTLAAVPAAERSVSEDTGLDRKTCREALRRLCSANVLVLVDQFDYSRERGQGAGANTYAPNLLALNFATGSQTPPPSSHTPSPAHPLWIGLPPGSLSLWISAVLEGPSELTDLRRSAGYQEPKNGNLSTRQSQLLTCRMDQLRDRGLLATRQGRWELRLSRRAPAAPARGWSEWRGRRRQYAAERTEFRAARAADRTRYREEWAAGRERCQLERASADRLRRARWWYSLSEAERTFRKRVWKEIYNSLTPYDQYRRKELLRSRWAEAELHDREVMLAA
ncbi:hypothetical protein GCM10009789_83320 [Kribbella sancticallisti]|uniref:Uncharacterized protein n=1 Tax=Kribbella sancticallisti TaxID=460087 RepID=A0ABP4QN11_9ACTN